MGTRPSEERGEGFHDVGGFTLPLKAMANVSTLSAWDAVGRKSRLKTLPGSPLPGTEIG